MSRRLSDEFVAQMYSDYQAGLSLCALGRIYNRDRRSIGEIFVNRGYVLRPGTNPNAARVGSGRFAPAAPLSEKEIDALIAGATKLTVPPALKLEWRKWSMQRRGEFIARLRAKLNSPKDRPTTPFSANVEPFDYTSPRAREIADKLNAGRNSQYARIKIDIRSQGVIWLDRLWFWSAKVGYQSGPWTPTEGRPLLHRVIWEDWYGKKLVPDNVIYFLDGNPNNLAPGNLALKSRNDVCRENHARALSARSRELTSILLKRAQRKEKDGFDDTIASLRR